MNIKLILFSSFCFISAVLSAQSFKTIPLKKNGRPDFIGANKQYFFFDAYENKLLLINRSNVLDKKMVAFDSVAYFYSENTLLNENEIISIQKRYNNVQLKNNTTKSIANQFSFFICDAMTGKIIKNKSIVVNDTFNISIDKYINKKDKTITIYRKDSIIEVLDYQLNHIDFKSTHFREPYTNVYQSYFVDKALLNSLFKDLKLDFDIFVNVGKSNNDTNSFKNYNIKFQTIEDDNIKYFKQYYKSIVIYNKSKSDSIEIDFPSDKRILEMEFKTNEANELIFYGKSANINNDNYIYEMFSTVISQNIKVVSNLKFFDLTNINYGIGEFYPFRENAGLVYCRLRNPDYEFHIKDEKLSVYFYQKRYSNIYDIIYIVKVHDNGEIVLNKVVSQIKNEKNLPNLLYSVVQVKNQFNIIWYENDINMQNAVYDMKHRFILTDVKQKNTHLATTTYNPMEDEFTDKKILASKSEIKDYLSMSNSYSYYDEYDHSTYFFVVGVDKKNKVKNLYIFNYTN
jgi:hypothetical protein